MALLPGQACRICACEPLRFDRFPKGSSFGVCALCGAVHRIILVAETNRLFQAISVYGDWLPYVRAYYEVTGNRIGHTALDPSSKVTAPEMEAWIAERLEFTPTPFGIWMVEAAGPSGEHVLRKLLSWTAQPAEGTATYINAADLPPKTMVIVRGPESE